MRFLRDGSRLYDPGDPFPHWLVRRERARLRDEVSRELRVLYGYGVAEADREARRLIPWEDRAGRPDNSARPNPDSPVTSGTQPPKTAPNPTSPH